jgi:hypothetical protein
MQFESNASNVASSARSPRQPLRPPQLIADGHVRPPRRAIRRDDRRLGQHRAIERAFCREQRGNALILERSVPLQREHAIGGKPEKC